MRARKTKGRPRNDRSHEWAAKVREMRLHHGWTQDELAIKWQRVKRYIERIEREFIVPPAEDRVRLENILQITQSESARLRGLVTQEAHERLLYPQRVSWGPANDLPPGVQIWTIKSDQEIVEDFIPWKKFQIEMKTILLPWVLTKPTEHKLETRAFSGKPDWIVWLTEPCGNWYCDVWLGGDPDRNWDFDGLIRFGDANSKPRNWITFQRYSDGTYRKIHSLYETLNEAKEALKQASSAP